MFPTLFGAAMLAFFLLRVIPGDICEVRFGGIEGGTHDVVEAYDIEGGSWSAAEPMATPRKSFAAVAGP